LELPFEKLKALEIGIEFYKRALQAAKVTTDKASA